jgi:hypothetical protein
MNMPKCCVCAELEQAGQGQARAAASQPAGGHRIRLHSGPGASTTVCAAGCSVCSDARAAYCFREAVPAVAVSSWSKANLEKQLQSYLNNAAEGKVPSKCSEEEFVVYIEEALELGGAAKIGRPLKQAAAAAAAAIPQPSAVPAAAPTSSQAPAADGGRVNAGAAAGRRAGNGSSSRQPLAASGAAVAAGAQGSAGAAGGANGVGQTLPARTAGHDSSGGCSLGSMHPPAAAAARAGGSSSGRQQPVGMTDTAANKGADQPLRPGLQRGGVAAAPAAGASAAGAAASLHSKLAAKAAANAMARPGSSAAAASAHMQAAPPQYTRVHHIR